MSMIMPPELFLIDDAVKTMDQAQEVLTPLNLEWQVKEDEKGGKAAIAVLHHNPETKEVWAISILEKTHTTAHRHNNPDSIYGEMNFTLAGRLPDVTDLGQETAHVRGAILCHEGGTDHHSVYADFWVGVYHQPMGSTPI